MTWRYTLEGEVPSKKNSRVLVFRGSRPRSIVSGSYRIWNTDALASLIAKRLPKTPLSGVEVHICMYFSTNRRKDLSNAAEGVMDTLVEAGILSDDCWQVVPKLTIEAGGVDKKNPRSEIEIRVL